MMHSTRVWSVGKESTVREASEWINRYSSFTSCSAFHVRSSGGQSFLLLNDSTSEDALQEFAIMRVDRVEGSDWHGTQIESFTVTWICREGGADALEASLIETLEDTDDPMTSKVVAKVEASADHSCGGCR